MPFVFDQSEQPEDTDLFSPRLDQFVYLPPPEFHPAPQPVRFSIAPVGEIEPEVPPIQASQPKQVRRTFMDMLRGRPAVSTAQPAISHEERRRRQDRRTAQRAQQFFSIVVPVLKTAGVRRVYCRCDGGNDEGFAWFERYESEGGARIEDAVVGQGLHDLKIDEVLAAEKFTHHSEWTPDRGVAALGRFVGGMLSERWASMLLGYGYGTGEYLMYGAFTVDLEECSIADDPGAEPIVENIEIKR